MKLERIKCKHLSRAWDITVSRNYLAACTGRRAVILSRELELLHTVEGLDYVYAAVFSPDEAKLLLIANGSKFYILDMASKGLEKLTVRAPYNYNLEGRGCWSFDGGHILIPVQHSGSLNSTLRVYRADDLTIFEDFLPQRYNLTGIRRLEKTKFYLLIGQDRTDDRKYLLFFDGEAVTARVLEDSEQMVVFGCDVDEEAGIVTLYTNPQCRRYRFDGSLAEVVPPPLAPDDPIQKYALSPRGRYRFFGTKGGFTLTDAKTGDILAHIPEEYGVQNVTPIAPDTVALSTWSGVKLYRMTEE